MTSPDPQPRHILITLTSRQPSATEVKRLMARLGIDDVSDAAVDQLIGAAAAANRWLADHPDEASRLLDDPAAVLEAIEKSGALAESPADLLAVLRSLRKRVEGTPKARARLVRVLRPKTASFGQKPVLRFGSEYDQPKGRGGR
jgi:hypothetical protein